MAYDYFYDAQMKRFLQQIVRAFSGFKYRTGRTVNGLPEERTVPCRMATQSRMVAQIMRGGDNALLTVPIITVAMTGLTRKPENDHNHTFRGTIQVSEREKDPVTGQYTGNRGQGYTVERLMPVPFEMTIQVDIWTSNMDQKFQLLEPILAIAGREFDIQNSDNALDWAALTTMRLSDITLTSRSVQIGTEDEIDFATLTYTMPFFINPPAKITRQTLIHEVRTNVDVGEEPSGQGEYVRTIVTPNDYRIAINRGIITLLGVDEMPANWSDLGPVYRTHLLSGVTQLRLRKTGDPESMEIVGTIFDTNDPTQMSWQIDIDTLPANTLPPINAIVKPLDAHPGAGLPAAVNGQRYIVYQDVGTTFGWGDLNAKQYDIIEYRNGVWIVVSRAAEITDALLLNLSTGNQLRCTDHVWELAIDGIYGPGYWRIFS